MRVTDAGGLKPAQWVQRRRTEALGRARTTPTARDGFAGHWVQPVPRRLVSKVILGVACLGAALGLGLTVVVQTPDALAVLVGFTVIALIAYTTLTVSNPTTVTLQGPVLTVERAGETDVFDLSGHIRRVATIGFPGRPNWLLQLETPDGKIVELDVTQVDPQVVHAAIAHYRTSPVPQQRNGH